jgi:hypothetical protein
MKSEMEISKGDKTAYIEYNDEKTIKEIAIEAKEIYRYNYIRIRNNYYLYLFEEKKKYGEKVANIYANQKSVLMDKIINELDRLIRSIDKLTDKQNKQDAFFAVTIIRGILENEEDPSFYYSLLEYNYAVLVRVNDYIDFIESMNNDEIHSILKV